MKRVIDFERAKRALAELDRIAEENPDRVDHSGPKWADHLDELDTLVAMGTPTRIRTQHYRERKLEKGYVSTTVFVPEETHQRLARLAENAEMKRGDLVALALKEFEERHPRGRGNERCYGDAAMWSLVSQYVDEQLAGAEIARRLTAEGYSSSNGAALRGYRVLTDYQKWREANSRPDFPKQPRPQGDAL